MFELTRSDSASPPCGVRGHVLHLVHAELGGGAVMVSPPRGVCEDVLHCQAGTPSIWCERPHGASSPLWRGTLVASSVKR
eukprot:6492532-Amphidinium_carterae.2